MYYFFMTYKLRVLCFGKVLDFITKTKKYKNKTKSSDIFGNLFHIGIDFSVIDNKSRWDFLFVITNVFFIVYSQRYITITTRFFLFCLDAVKIKWDNKKPLRIETSIHHADHLCTVVHIII